MTSDEPLARPTPPLCAICNSAESKYRCPACNVRTCSGACVQKHKQDTGCTGKRPPAEFVAPLKAFTDSMLLRDYGLLEQADFAVDRANRDFNRGNTDLKLDSASRHRKRIILARVCAAPERQMKLVLAPGGMSLARRNTTYVVGGPVMEKGKGKGKTKGKEKGKGKGKGKWDKGKGKGKTKTKVGFEPYCINWRVEWHFGACDKVFAHRTLKETEVLGTVLAALLESDPASGQPTKHMLLPYAEAGLEQLEVFLEQPGRARLATTLAKGGLSTAEAGATGCETSEEEDDSEQRQPDAEQQRRHSRGEEGDEPPDKKKARTLEGAARHDTAPSEEASDLEGEESEEESDEETAVAKVEDALPKDAPPFLLLDKNLTLMQNFRGHAIMEYPVFHVALPKEVPNFQVAQKLSS